MKTKFNNIFKQSSMLLHKCLFFIFCHPSLATLQFLYPKQTFELPKHPLNWICTVHITVATFANYTSSDITERFLKSNREYIIPTLSSMLNRSISIVPVVSFFEPCTVSVLIDATISGSSYVFSKIGIVRYIDANEYVYRGWRHSIVILIYFSCARKHYHQSHRLPHRLFYHSLDCGPENTFPNQLFVPDPLKWMWTLNDPTFNIYYRELLPVAMRSVFTRPKYIWDKHDPNLKHDQCLASRWDKLSQMSSCDVSRFAVHHFRHFLNFTAVASAPDKVQNYGMLITGSKYKDVRHSISLHVIDNRNDRLLYCDRKSDSPRLRPINLSSPFSFNIWLTLGFSLMLCATASSVTMFEVNSLVSHWTSVKFIKTICNSLVELIACLLENNIGKNNCTKAFIGLIAICVGNTYKNYLTIELVYPRAGDAIGNVTQLLDLRFNIIAFAFFDGIQKNKSTWLSDVHLNLEIDELKREMYISEVDRWLSFFPLDQNTLLMNKITNVSEKNALVISGSDRYQVFYLQLLKERSYPFSCHFVKRPFAHEFRELYFFNSKAEMFKGWTAKFLDHGLVDFWKHLESHSYTLIRRKLALQTRAEMSNSSSTEALDVANFMGQVHLLVFYIVIAILTTICIAIFIIECGMQNVRGLSLFVLTIFQHVNLEVF
jgi:hypothetical protein